LKFVFFTKITATCFFTVHSHNAVIVLRDLQSCNRGPQLVTGAPKPHAVPGPHFYTLTTGVILSI